MGARTGRPRSVAERDAAFFQSETTVSDSTPPSTSVAPVDTLGQASRTRNDRAQLVRSGKDQVGAMRSTYQTFAPLRRKPR
jgi:hypothetical protein